MRHISRNCPTTGNSHGTVFVVSDGQGSEAGGPLDRVHVCVTLCLNGLGSQEVRSGPSDRVVVSRGPVSPR